MTRIFFNQEVIAPITELSASDPHLISLVKLNEKFCKYINSYVRQQFSYLGPEKQFSLLRKKLDERVKEQKFKKQALQFMIAQNKSHYLELFQRQYSCRESMDHRFIRALIKTQQQWTNLCISSHTKPVLSCQNLLSDLKKEYFRALKVQAYDCANHATALNIIIRLFKINFGGHHLEKIISRKEQADIARRAQSQPQYLATEIYNNVIVSWSCAFVGLPRRQINHDAVQQWKLLQSNFWDRLAFDLDYEFVNQIVKVPKERQDKAYFQELMLRFDYYRKKYGRLPIAFRECSKAMRGVKKNDISEEIFQQHKACLKKISKKMVSAKTMVHHQLSHYGEFLCYLPADLASVAMLMRLHLSHLDAMKQKVVCVMEYRAKYFGRLREIADVMCLHLEQGLQCDLTVNPLQPLRDILNDERQRVVYKDQRYGDLVFSGVVNLGGSYESERNNLFMDIRTTDPFIASLLELTHKKSILQVYFSIIGRFASRGRLLKLEQSTRRWSIPFYYDAELRAFIPEAVSTLKLIEYRSQQPWLMQLFVRFIEINCRMTNLKRRVAALRPMHVLEIYKNPDLIFIVRQQQRIKAFWKQLSLDLPQACQALRPHIKEWQKTCFYVDINPAKLIVDELVHNLEIAEKSDFDLILDKSSYEKIVRYVQILDDAQYARLINTCNMANLFVSHFPDNIAKLFQFCIRYTLSEEHRSALRFFSDFFYQTMTKKQFNQQHSLAQLEHWLNSSENVNGLIGKNAVVRLAQHTVDLFGGGEQAAKRWLVEVLGKKYLTAIHEGYSPLSKALQADYAGEQVRVERWINQQLKILLPVSMYQTSQKKILIKLKKLELRKCEEVLSLIYHGICSYVDAFDCAGKKMLNTSLIVDYYQVVQSGSRFVEKIVVKLFQHDLTLLAQGGDAKGWPSCKEFLISAMKIVNKSAVALILLNFLIEKLFHLKSFNSKALIGFFLQLKEQCALCLPMIVIVRAIKRSEKMKAETLLFCGELISKFSSLKDQAWYFAWSLVDTIMNNLNELSFNPKQHYNMCYEKIAVNNPRRSSFELMVKIWRAIFSQVLDRQHRKLFDVVSYLADYYLSSSLRIHLQGWFYQQLSDHLSGQLFCDSYLWLANYLSRPAHRHAAFRMAILDILMVSALQKNNKPLFFSMKKLFSAQLVDYQASGEAYLKHMVIHKTQTANVWQVVRQELYALMIKKDPRNRGFWSNRLRSQRKLWLLDTLMHTGLYIARNRDLIAQSVQEKNINLLQGIFQVPLNVRQQQLNNYFNINQRDSSSLIALDAFAVKENFLCTAAGYPVIIFWDMLKLIVPRVWQLVHPFYVRVIQWSQSLNSNDLRSSLENIFKLSVNNQLTSIQYECVLMILQQLCSRMSGLNPKLAFQLAEQVSTLLQHHCLSHWQATPNKRGQMQRKVIQARLSQLRLTTSKVTDLVARFVDAVEYACRKGINHYINKLQFSSSQWRTLFIFIKQESRAALATKLRPALESASASPLKILFTHVLKLVEPVGTQYWLLPEKAEQHLQAILDVKFFLEFLYSLERFIHFQETKALFKILKNQEQFAAVSSLLKSKNMYLFRTDLVHSVFLAKQPLLALKIIEALGSKDQLIYAQQMQKANCAVEKCIKQLLSFDGALDVVQMYQHLDGCDSAHRGQYYRSLSHLLKDLFTRLKFSRWLPESDVGYFDFLKPLAACYRTEHAQLLGVNELLELQFKRIFSVLNKNITMGLDFFINPAESAHQKFYFLICNKFVVEFCKEQPQLEKLRSAVEHLFASKINNVLKKKCKQDVAMLDVSWLSTYLHIWCPHAKLKKRVGALKKRVYNASLSLFQETFQEGLLAIGKNEAVPIYQALSDLLKKLPYLTGEKHCETVATEAISHLEKNLFGDCRKIIQKIKIEKPVFNSLFRRIVPECISKSKWHVLKKVSQFSAVIFAFGNLEQQARLLSRWFNPQLRNQLAQHLTDILHWYRNLHARHRKFVEQLKCHAVREPDHLKLVDEALYQSLLHAEKKHRKRYRLLFVADLLVIRDQLLKKTLSVNKTLGLILELKQLCDYHSKALLRYRKTNNYELKILRAYRKVFACYAAPLNMLSQALHATPKTANAHFAQTLKQYPALLESAVNAHMCTLMLTKTLLPTKRIFLEQLFTLFKTIQREEDILPIYNVYLNYLGRKLSSNCAHLSEYISKQQKALSPLQRQLFTRFWKSKFKVSLPAQQYTFTDSNPLCLI